MKSNFNELFENRLSDFKSASDISIEDVLDEMMSEFKYEKFVERSWLIRKILRAKLTSALNHNQIYSYEKGKFVSLDNADEAQLTHFMDKAKKDIEAAEIRKAKAESILTQISMAWDEQGNFIGYNVPKAINE